MVLNTETLKSSRTLVSVAMSNQIEDDEVAQFVAKAANFDTPSGVSVVVSVVCRNSKTARNGECVVVFSGGVYRSPFPYTTLRRAR